MVNQMSAKNWFIHDRLVASLDCHRAGDGFTLVELISVVAIIAILAALAIPAYGVYITKAQTARAIAEIRMLEKEIIIYQTDEGHLPDSLVNIGYGDLKDPWGWSYQYLSFDGLKGNGNKRRDRAVNPLNSDYDLYSIGRDGESKLPIALKESLDDIVRANEGAFIDLAEKF